MEEGTQHWQNAVITLLEKEATESVLWDEWESPRPRSERRVSEAEEQHVQRLRVPVGCCQRGTTLKVRPAGMDFIPI